MDSLKCCFMDFFEGARKLIQCHTISTLTICEKLFKNIVEKGENASHQHFLLFPQCFFPILKTILIFQYILSSANVYNLVKAKNVPFG